MSYTQLTREQRYQIHALMKAGNTQTRTAEIVGCHKSTISREVRRNRGRRGYRPKQAYELAVDRHLAAYCPRIAAPTWVRIEALVRQQWSPEQISGRLKLEGQPSASHERIYQHIYADKRGGGTLHLSLRCRRVRRKRYGTRSRRGQIPNRVSIEARPAVVDARARLGDWEADTIIGANHQGAILSLTERKSKLVCLCKTRGKTAEEVARASLALLSPLSAKVHTITSDNVLPKKASWSQRQSSPAQVSSRSSSYF